MNTEQAKTFYRLCVVSSFTKALFNIGYKHRIKTTLDAKSHKSELKKCLTNMYKEEAKRMLSGDDNLKIESSCFIRRSYDFNEPFFAKVIVSLIKNCNKKPLAYIGEESILVRRKLLYQNIGFAYLADVAANRNAEFIKDFEEYMSGNRKFEFGVILDDINNFLVELNDAIPEFAKLDDSEIKIAVLAVIVTLTSVEISYLFSSVFTFFKYYGSAFFSKFMSIMASENIFLSKEIEITHTDNFFYADTSVDGELQNPLYSNMLFFNTPIAQVSNRIITVSAPSFDTLKSRYNINYIDDVKTILSKVLNMDFLSSVNRDKLYDDFYIFKKGYYDKDSFISIMNYLSDIVSDGYEFNNSIENPYAFMMILYSKFYSKKDNFFPVHKTFKNLCCFGITIDGERFAVTNEYGSYEDVFFYKKVISEININIGIQEMLDHEAIESSIKSSLIGLSLNLSV